MKKLFIIGNGFDLAHNIPSTYESFRQYLISLLNDISGKNYKNYSFDDSSIITTDYNDTLENEILTIMYFLSNAEAILAQSKTKTRAPLNNDIIWKEIEKSVGDLNYDDFSWLYVDESANDKENRANMINEDILSPYVKVLCKISKYFSEWINQIVVDDAKKCRIKDFENMIDSNSKFLCFNYTDTLETVYKINREDICYIHGKIKESNNIFFGHGNGLTYEDFINDINNPNHFSVAAGYSTINDVLSKPVECIIEKNNEFFESLTDIEYIFSYGFSYGVVDEPYIARIISSVSNNVIWNVVLSRSKSIKKIFPSLEEQKQYIEIIEKCGYKGSVKKFEVNIN